MMGEHIWNIEGIWHMDKRSLMPKINRYCRMCQHYQASGNICQHCLHDPTGNTGNWGWREINNKPQLTRAHNDFCIKPYGWKVTTIFRTRREAQEYMRK